eukprot:TRINITY_DN23462_c0_g1_i1.p1 TRINITY_DN23462_c0_g1~~TRINITY_DN23462_c0_g1_i1.p1  ORF type:complete len:202 (+),score=32.09 TRINITY_DN23462_c0_g1_i1:590-1195(+)
MLMQIVLATLGMHQAGVVHYDLKPQNILLDGGLAGYFGVPKVRLTDFGCSQTFNPAGGATFFIAPEVRDTCGTVRYMAPEARLGHSATFAADWWSVGVIALTLAVGKLEMPSPFTDRAGIKFIEQLTSSPEKLNPSLKSSSPVVKDFIALLTKYFLNINPNARLNSVHETSKSFKGEFFADKFWQGGKYGTWNELRALGQD